MEGGKKFRRGKIETGKLGYLNQNCWLVRTLNYAPYERCRYCELKFRKCLFLHYQIVSLVLIVFFLALSFLINGEAVELVIISVFTLVIIYGYFLNKSTGKIIQANFAERRAKEALEELAGKLEEKVDEQTKELKDAYEELKKLDKAKSEFLSIASHQLRTPLTAIKGYISMMLENTYGEVSQKMQIPLKNIYASNESLIHLVNTLLDISRIEAGKMEMELNRTSLEDIVTSSIDELKIGANQKDLYLKWEKSKTPLPEILVDREKIRQVILNLIDNAIKYTNQGGITIKCRMLNTKCQISVSDTGEGLTKEEMNKMFESFSRGIAGIRLFAGGAGLGLYVAKKFIEMHQGRIWVESEGKNKGSTFYIELPIK